MEVWDQRYIGVNNRAKKLFTAQPAWHHVCDVCNGGKGTDTGWSCHAAGQTTDTEDGKSGIKMKVNDTLNQPISFLKKNKPGNKTNTGNTTSLILNHHLAKICIIIILVDDSHTETDTWTVIERSL